MRRRGRRISARAEQFWKNAGWSSLHPVQVGMGGPMVLVNLVVILAVVQVGSLFSADAWNNITFTAGEVKNPRRNIPLSLVLGTGFVLTVYFLVSLGYLLVLPMHGDPNGATVMARGIAVCDGRSRGYGGAGADISLRRRVADGGGDSDFDVWLRQWNDAGRGARLLRDEPGRIVFQVGGQAASALQDAGGGAAGAGGWTVVLCVSGSYSQLLDYIIFAVLVFYILTIVGLFVLRFKRPDAERPYKALGYPVLPGLYILMAAWICVVLLRYKPQYTWPGLVLVLLGIPVYLFWSRRRAKSQSQSESN